MSEPQIGWIFQFPGLDSVQGGGAFLRGAFGFLRETSSFPPPPGRQKYMATPVDKEKRVVGL